MYRLAVAIFIMFSAVSLFASTYVGKVVYEVNTRNYSEQGKFEAITDDLQRIKDLGVDIIWLMPINPIGKLNRKGTLGSPYSVRVHNEINKNLGTQEEFKKLVGKAHQLGMKVILDWVANHTAWDHEWTVTNPDFYLRDENGNFMPPDPSWEDVIDLDYDNKDLWRAMTEQMLFWITEFDIDGFRCDVASMIPTSFWEYSIPKLRQVKDVYMLGESIEKDLLFAGFNAVHGDYLYRSLISLKNGNMSVSEIWDVVQSDQDNHPVGSSIMYFLSNHDTNFYHLPVPQMFGDAAQVFTVLTYLLPGQVIKSLYKSSRFRSS